MLSDFSRFSKQTPEPNPTQHFSGFVGFRSSTQPTEVQSILTNYELRITNYELQNDRFLISVDSASKPQFE